VDRTAGFLDYYFGADADEDWIESMMAFDTAGGNEDAALVAAAQAGGGRQLDRPRATTAPGAAPGQLPALRARSLRRGGAWRRVMIE
jgi:hypothetical protein